MRVKPFWSRILASPIEKEIDRSGPFVPRLLGAKPAPEFRQSSLSYCKTSTCQTLKAHLSLRNSSFGSWILRISRSFRGDSFDAEEAETHKKAVNLAGKTKGGPAKPG